MSAEVSVGMTKSAGRTPATRVGSAIDVEGFADGGGVGGEAAAAKASGR